LQNPFSKIGEHLTPDKDKFHYGRLQGCSGWPKTNPSSDKNTPRALAID
jgi:hypothetical protein